MAVWGILHCVIGLQTSDIADEQVQGDHIFYSNGSSIRLCLDIWAIAWWTDVQQFWACVIWL